MDIYRVQIVTCNMGVSLHSRTHPLFMKYSNGTSTSFCIPAFVLVSSAFSTIIYIPHFNSSLTCLHSFLDII